MLLREKLKTVVPGRLSGAACFSALRGFARRAFAGEPQTFTDSRYTLARTYDAQAISPDLSALLATLKTIRRRILTNEILGGWTKEFVWLLAALFVARFYYLGRS